MLRKALDHDATVVVFLDYDLSWPAGELLKLVETEGDVIAGTYRCKVDEEQYMGTIFSGPDGSPLVRDDGCIKAGVAPAGFLKITPEAVEMLMRDYPELCYGPRQRQSIDLFNHGAHDRLYWGEDYAFCRRWREKCGDVWIKPDLSLTHWMGDKPYPGNFHHRRQRIRQPHPTHPPERGCVMPTTIIEHPDHGRHVVYTTAELEWHKARGWAAVVVTKPEPKKPEPKKV
jgi:hypothetical protein